MRLLQQNDPTTMGPIKDRPIALEYREQNRCCVLVRGGTTTHLRILIFKSESGKISRERRGPETEPIKGTPGGTFLSDSHLITSSHDKSSNRLVLRDWTVNPGSIVMHGTSGNEFGTPGGSVSFPDGLSVMAIRTEGGDLKVIDFTVENGSFGRVKNLQMGPIIDNPSITETERPTGGPDLDGFEPLRRFTTAVQNESGRLMVINIEQSIMRFTQPPPNNDTLLETPRFRLTRRGDNGNDGQTGVFGRPAVSGHTSDPNVFTAVSTEVGGLVITRYETLTDGRIAFIDNAVLAINERVSGSPSIARANGAAGRTEFVTAVVLNSGALRVDRWSIASGTLRHVSGNEAPLDLQFSPTIAPEGEGGGDNGFYVAARRKDDLLSVTHWVFN